MFFIFRERESLPSLLNRGRSDRRISSGQEGKLFYSKRTTCKHQFQKFLKNSIKVGVLSYLFYTLFKCFTMFVLVCGHEGPFDPSQNLGPNYWNFLDPFVQPVAVLGTVLGCCVMIY